MHTLAFGVGVSLVVLMLIEFFITFLLPRRVKRDPGIARAIYRLVWHPWRALARRLPTVSGDTLLGFFGPVALLTPLVLWTLGLIVGFALLQWGSGSDVRAGGGASFGDDLYFSAGAFLSASTNLSAQDTVARVLVLLEAAAGFAVLFVVIGYLPALYQAFSRREVAVSQLDPRAGSPPSAGALLERSAEHGRWTELDSYLEDWETWAAELMETHLSYPILAYFRSQHVNQNWLAALTVVLDTCAVRIAALPDGSAEPARLSFAIGRHALADLAYTFRARPQPPVPDRLSGADLGRVERLVGRCQEARVEDRELRRRLIDLRSSYEPYANALSRALALPLPPWLPPQSR